MAVCARTGPESREACADKKMYVGLWYMVFLRSPSELIQLAGLVATARIGASLHQNSTALLSSPAAKQYLEVLTAAASVEEGQPQLEVFEAAIRKAPLLSAAGRSQEALDALDNVTPYLRVGPNQLATNEDVWSATCIVDGNTAKGELQEALREMQAASDTYSGLLPFIADLLPASGQSRELQRSLDRFLSNACGFIASTNYAGPHHTVPLMTALRLLSKLETPSSSSPRRQVWRVYYETITRLVAEGSVFTASSIVNRNFLGTVERLNFSNQQYAELQRVQIQYEKLLLQDAKFPKAGQSNLEVLSWIDLVMSNWRVVCGPNWTEDEIGSDSKVALGRKTLDVSRRTKSGNAHGKLTYLMFYRFSIVPRQRRSTRRSCCDTCSWHMYTLESSNSLSKLSIRTLI